MGSVGMVGMVGMVVTVVVTVTVVTVVVVTTVVGVVVTKFLVVVVVKVALGVLVVLGVVIWKLLFFGLIAFFIHGPSEDTNTRHHSFPRVHPKVCYSAHKARGGHACRLTLDTLLGGA